MALLRVHVKKTLQNAIRNLLTEILRVPSVTLKMQKPGKRAPTENSQIISPHSGLRAGMLAFPQI